MAMSAAMSVEEVHDGASQQNEIRQEPKGVAPMLPENKEEDDGGQ